MWSFIIVPMEPLIKIFLKLLHGWIKLFPECLAEELIQDRPVEPLDKAVGPGPRHLGPAMLDVRELQKDLIRMDHRSTAVFPAVVREDILNLQTLSLVEGQYPVVKDIHRAGHEIASHGWDHRRVTTQQPAEFRASVRRTKERLESLTGAPVLGFRAPSFSIVPGLEWAFDVLIEEGYRYDSSLFPVRRPRGYGYPGAQRSQHRFTRPSGTLLEFPIMTLRRFGVSIPAGGGAYFRILPYGLVRAAFAESERNGTAGTFYLHPWELDPEQPRVAAPWLSRARHYTGLRRTKPRLERLLSAFQFSAIADSAALR